jgi:RNA polymerase sigma-70 factor (ECF subfamily)
LALTQWRSPAWPLLARTSISRRILRGAATDQGGVPKDAAEPGEPPPAVASMSAGAAVRSARPDFDAARGDPPAAAAPREGEVHAARQQFFAVYDQYFPYVWRNLRRLGVAPDAVDDVAQDVFLVVHRRLPEFEGRSELRTWLYSIVLHTVRDHRRLVRRKRRPEVGAEPLEASVDPAGGPHEEVERAEEVRRLYALLDELDEDLRDVFVLSELEELSAPEIAQVTGANVNTVYGRLARARRAFQAAVARRRAKDARSQR